MTRVSDLEISIQNYVYQLISAYPRIKEIWLFGARANNWVHENSDWDFIVKSDKKTFDSLKKDLDLQSNAAHLAIDLFVGPDENDYFQNPWRKARLSFKKDSLNWREISPEVALYEACDLDLSPQQAKAKGLPEGINSFREPNAKAYRI